MDRYEQLEREHLGDPDLKTGIYAEHDDFAVPVDNRIQMCPYCMCEHLRREILDHVKYEHPDLITLPDDYTVDRLCERWAAIGF